MPCPESTCPIDSALEGPEMAIHEAMLRDVLVALAEQCRQQHLEIAGLAIEVGALHKAIHKSDPTFEEQISSRKSDPTLNQKIDAVTERFDEIVRRLRTDVIHSV
jgi:hypothetical protein